MMRRTTLRRRTLLASGVSMLAAPLFRAQDSHAQSEQKRRFVAMAHPIGQMNAWLPTGGLENFVLSDQTKSLQPFRDKLIFVRGMRSGLTEFGNTSGAHVLGLQSTFTGRRPTRNGNTRNSSINISIDQEIADRMQADSLALGVLAGGNIADVVSHKAGGAPIYAENNAIKVFDLMFEQIGGDALQQQMLRARRKSMFDLWGTELTELKLELGNEQQQHLEAHLTELRRLERNLGEVVAVCEAPALQRHQASFYTRSANYRAIGKQMMDLIVAGFRCDKAQVASLVWHNGGQAGITYPWLNSNKGHHALTHDSNVDAANAELARIYAWYTEQFAYLLQQLQDTPDGEGNLLDNTVLFWTSALGSHRSHSGRDMRVLVAGNAGGYFKTGRYIQSPFEGNFTAGLPLNDLMSELVQGVTGSPTRAFHSDDMKTKNEMPDLRA